MNDTILVSGYDARLYVERGHLVVRDGFPSEGKLRELRFPRGRCEVTRIVVRAPGGTISMPAIDWCARMGVALSFVASDSTLLNCMTADHPHDGPVKRAQAISAVTDDALRLARYLLTQKLTSQIDAIDHNFARSIIGNTTSRKAAISQVASCRDALSTATTLVDFLTLEGRAAQVYWDLLVETPLPWRAWSYRRIPAHWAAIAPRTSGRRERVRDATDPFNAILNYSYTLLEVETRIACEAAGLDPDLGLLHVDDRLRESFIYDLLEPLRAPVDMLALEYLHKIELRPHLFHELRDGVVRLDPDLAEGLAKALMPQIAKRAAHAAGDFLKQVRKVQVPYRLGHTERTSVEASRTRPNATHCGYCGETLHRKGLKFCGRPCYLKYSVEVAKPIEKACERLAEMRAAGLSPGHGGEAARKRGTKVAESNRKRSLGLTPAEYRSRRAVQARARRLKQCAKGVSH